MNKEFKRDTNYDGTLLHGFSKNFRNIPINKRVVAGTRSSNARRTESHLNDNKPSSGIPRHRLLGDAAMYVTFTDTYIHQGV